MPARLEYVSAEQTAVLVPDPSVLMTILIQESAKIKMQVSTRGVGVSLLATARTTQRMKSPPALRDFPSAKMYRTMLACVEEKMASVSSQGAQRAYDLSHCREFMSNDERRAILSGISWMPRSFVNYILHLGTFSSGGNDYIPVAEVDRYADDGSFLPEPGRVYLGNLYGKRRGTCTQCAATLNLADDIRRGSNEICAQTEGYGCKLIA